MEACPPKQTLLWFPLLLLPLACIGSSLACELNSCRVPLVRFTCEPRNLKNEDCGEAAAAWRRTDFHHRGSELNNGRLTITESDDECCELCHNTTGCRVWSRFYSADEYNPVGACWLKSSTNGAAESESTNSGVVSPPEGSSPCNIMVGVGFRNIPPYNFPDLLIVQDAETCCRWCQDATEFCTGWTWGSESKHCSLYGTNLKQGDEYTCRDCFSGTRTADRDDLKNISFCDSSKFINVVYKQSSEVQIIQEGSIATKTSNECCGLCARSKDCRSWSWTKDLQCALNADIPRPEEDSSSVGGVAAMKTCNYEKCINYENVQLVSADLSKSQFAIPQGESFLVPNKEACCARCQEFPECNAWVFEGVSASSKYSPCTILSASFGAILFKRRSEPDVWSGIVASRLTEAKRNESDQKFKELSEMNPDDSNTLVPPAVIASIIAAIVLLILACCMLYYFVGRRKRRQKEHMTRDSAKLYPTPPPVVKRLPMSKIISSTSPAPTDFPSEPYSTIEGSSIFGQSMVSSSQHTVEDIEAKEQFLKDCEEDSSLLAGYTRPIQISECDWVRYASKLTSLEHGLLLAGKYMIDGGHHVTEESIVLNAVYKKDPGEHLVAIKFYRQDSMYEVEVDFFCNNRESPYVPQAFDVFTADVVESWGLPPLCCIAMERGSTTLSEMLNLHRGKLDHMDQRNFLYKICKAVADLHERGIVHRNIKPDNVVLYNKTLTWKLLDFGLWARKDSIGGMKYSLRSAPPELVEAKAVNKPLTVSPAADMWSLGVIFWEVLTGDVLFGRDYTDKQVLSMLLGLEDLPFERHPEMWHQIQNPVARRLVMNLLQRSPIKRWPIKTVLLNGYFFSAPDSMQLHERNEEVSSILSNIAGAIKSVETRVQKVESIAVENLKETVGNILIACISLYEIEDEELALSIQDDSKLAEMYSDKSLRVHKTLLEPNFNVFKRANGEPAILLRQNKNHLIKVTLMYGGDVALDLPITKMVYARITPLGVEDDTQELVLFMVSNQGHVMDAVGVWNTTHHKDPNLQQIGNASLQICLGVHMKSTDEIVEVRKKIDIRMHQENERFRTVKQFYRSKKFYSNIPPWGKIYIHGAVAIVSLAMKGVL